MVIAAIMVVVVGSSGNSSNGQVRIGGSYRRTTEFVVPFFFPGIILGAFYYGYMVFQIPGGWLALRVGGARLFGAAVLIASILTVLTPTATRWSPIALITLRILEGLALVSNKQKTSRSLVYEKFRFHCDQLTFGRNFFSLISKVRCVNFLKSWISH